MGKRRCSVVAALATIMVVMVELAPLTVAKSGRSMLTNGLGMTPPMGWNSWNHFGCNIDEKIIRETADALVSTGLSKLGYEYVNIDDCWAEISRDDKVCENMTDKQKEIKKKQDLERRENEQQVNVIIPIKR